MKRLVNLIYRDFEDTQFHNTKSALVRSKKEVLVYFPSLRSASLTYKKLFRRSPQCFLYSMNFDLIALLHKTKTKVNARKELSTGVAGVDVWGNPFRTEVKEGQTVLRSSGNDHEFFTSDDEFYAKP